MHASRALIFATFVADITTIVFYKIIICLILQFSEKFPSIEGCSSEDLAITWFSIIGKPEIYVWQISFLNL